VIIPLISLLTICIFIYSPIHYGSVLSLSKYIIEFLIFLISFLFLVQIELKNKPLRINIVKLIPLICLIFLCLLQTLPLPSGTHKLLSSSSFELWDNSRIILSKIGSDYGLPNYTLSIYPFATINSTFLLGSLIVFGVFLARFINSSKRLYLVLAPIFLIGLVEALVGFFQSFYIYGIYNSQAAHGTFVNRNHYSGLLELIAPIVLGYAVSLNKNYFENFKLNIRALLDSDHVYQQLPVYLLFILIISAIAFSKSRMGILSAGISIFTFYIFISIYSNQYKKILWFIIGTGIFIISLSLMIDLMPIIERFMSSGYNQRFLVWKDSLNIIKNFPLFGSGLGTFKYIYPLYKENLKSGVDYHYAHNDYIHLLVETGLIGFTCLMTGLLILIRDAITFLNVQAKSGNSQAFFVTLGAFCSIVSILIHSIADFNLHIPSNALYFTTMIGIIYGVNSYNKAEPLGTRRRSIKTK